LIVFYLIKIEAQKRNLSYVRVAPKQRKFTVGKDTRLNVLLTIQENPVTPARQLAHQLTISTTVLKILRSGKLHPYKMQMGQELAEDDLDRRIQFCERMMNLMNSYECKIFLLFILYIFRAAGRNLVNYRS
jgi:hypothetical protein